MICTTASGRSGGADTCRSHTPHCRENYEQDTEDDKRLTLTVEEDVLVQLENLCTHPSVAAALGRKELKIHGWVYEFETGEFFAFDPDQGQFIELTEVSPPASAPDRTLPPI